MEINKTDIKIQIIKLQCVNIMDTVEFEKSLKVLNEDQILKRLQSQFNRVKFNITEIECLVDSLKNAKKKFEEMENLLGKQIDSITNIKDYIFIPKNQLKDNVTFDKVLFTSTNDGYIIECNSISRTDTLGLFTNQKINLICTENNVKKMLIVSNVHTFNDNDIKLNNHINDSTKITYIISIKL
jgi:hypothetical protein